MTEQVTDKYAFLRENLQVLVAEAASKGGYNPRAKMIIDLLADYDALHAEAEALRAENGRLKRSAQTNWNEFAEGAGEAAKLRAELEDLRSQLEAARGLLRDIYMTCNLREMPSEYAIRDISNQIEALLTATQAPEVPDHIEHDRALAEQGERQEAVVMGRVHHNPGHAEPVRAVLNSIGRQLPDNAALYAEPPAQDVSGLVRAGAQMANGCFNLSQDGCEVGDHKVALRSLAKAWDAALAAYRNPATVKRCPTCTGACAEICAKARP